MADYIESYDYTNTIRDMDPAWKLLIASKPSLSAFIKTGAPALALKHEWLEYQISPTRYTITGFDTDGDGTGVNFASTAGIVAGDILYFTDADGVMQTERALVASVDSATDLTLTRDYASSTGETLVIGWYAYNLNPHYENEIASANDGYEPGTNYNYLQLFKKVAMVSNTAQKVKTYNTADLLGMQIDYHMQKIAWELNGAAIMGYRLARSNTTSAKGTLGGIDQFTTSGNGGDKSGAALSPTIINDAFQQIAEDGGLGGNYIILTSPYQARAISGFNTSGTNPSVIYAPDMATYGTRIQNFVADFANGNNSYGGKIVVDMQVPKDMLFILNMDLIEFNYLRTMQDKPVLADYDGVARELLMELTMTVKNGTYAHARLFNLAVS